MNEDVFGDVFDAPRERAGKRDYATTRPGISKSYDEITEDLEARHSYGEAAAKQNAKEALEELYSSEFPIDDPPESFERYEAEMAVRHLRESIEGLASLWEVVEVNIEINEPGDLPAGVQFEGMSYVDSSENLLQQLESKEGRYDKVVLEGDVELAKSTIDVMATYGDLAESHIAALVRRDLPVEVREHAVETLAELRTESDEPKSLTAAIRDWWHSE